MTTSSQRKVVVARVPASFWRENVIVVVIPLRALATTVLTFLMNQKYNEAFRGVHFFRIPQKLFNQSPIRSRSRPRIKRSLI